MGYRIVRMPADIFNTVLTEGASFPDRKGRSLVCTQGLPPGAKLEMIDMGLRFDRDEVTLKYSHPSWEDIGPTQKIPELEICHSVRTTIDEPVEELVGV